METEWDPTQFFRIDEDHINTPFALLVLNQPINETALTLLKKHALLTVCADGGANRFYDWMKKHNREATELPDVIVGDLDSIHPSVLEHYRSHGVPIIQDEDKYTTDFTKSLNYIRGHIGEIPNRQTSSPSVVTAAAPTTAGRRQRQHFSILVLGGLGGRVDQAFSQIHGLYLMSQSFSAADINSGQEPDQREKERGGGDLYLISEESITFILRPGKNIIQTPRTNRPGCVEETYLLEENVGIIPLSGPARISTRGFQWDVQDWKTEIGGQLSTSNHIRDDVVLVETGVPVLFTVELADRLKRGALKQL